jgi:hypothetical protein
MFGYVLVVCSSSCSTPVLSASATRSSPLAVVPGAWLSKPPKAQAARKPSSLTQLQSLQEFDFTGQFWWKIDIGTTDNPAPRWGAISGGDPPSQANTQIQTTSWLAGGQDATQLFGWDELWQLEIDGTIAQNIQNAKANWTKISAQVPADVRRKTGAAGTVLRPLVNPQYSLLSFGGCDDVLEGNATCAGGDAHSITASGSGGERWNTIAPCVSARYGASLAQNHNDLFTQQVFMLFGLTDPSLYDDADPAAHGEIGVLNVDQGVWSRVLPACDPGNGTNTGIGIGTAPLGQPECPVPREGAAVVSSRTNLITGALDASDTIVFGGRDRNGTYLNDVWLLRATNATITRSNQTDWGAGYGNGVLQSGRFQNGQGVTVQVRQPASIWPRL